MNAAPVNDLVVYMDGGVISEGVSHLATRRALGRVYVRWVTRVKALYMYSECTAAQMDAIENAFHQGHGIQAACVANLKDTGRPCAKVDNWFE